MRVTNKRTTCSHPDLSPKRHYSVSNNVLMQNNFCTKTDCENIQLNKWGGGGGGRGIKQGSKHVVFERERERGYNGF